MHAITKTLKGAINKRNGVIFKTIRNARRLDRTPQDDILIEPDDVVEVLRSFW